MDIYIDEAGRWPLAWPVYVWLIQSVSGDIYQDSKTLSVKKREEMYSIIQEQTWRSYGRASAQYIDHKGIVAAIRHSIYQWLWRLLVQQPLPYTQAVLTSTLQSHKVHLHIDGNSDFAIARQLSIPVTTYIRWDGCILEISAASIIAKVSRDHYMIKQSKKYPDYGLAKHKWYGTQAHRDVIRRLWLTPIHRKSFCTRIIYD